MVIKNTFGCTVIPNPKFVNPDKLNQFSGSSLDRQKTPPKTKSDPKDSLPIERKLKSLSPRTKTKMRRKLLAFSAMETKLYFLTLTFLNLVDDDTALKIFQQFLDNVKKQDPEFQYFWVAERQTKNIVFKNNVHFHLITNKFWNIKKYKEYWVHIQKKNRVYPRDQNYSPSSSFDVRKITSDNLNGISIYLTKYVTKNESSFRFSPWNCSKKISELYTAMHTDFSFLVPLEELEKRDIIQIRRSKEEYCNMMLYPYNKYTKPLLNKLHEKNKAQWNGHLVKTP